MRVRKCGNKKTRNENRMEMGKDDMRTIRLKLELCDIFGNVH